MLVPARRVLQGLNYEFAKLQSFFADSNVDGSAALSITASLQTLLNRELGGAAAIYAQVDRLDAALNEVNGLLDASAPDISADIGVIRAQLAGLKSVKVVTDLEQGWLAALERAQTMMIKMIGVSAIPAAAKKSISAKLVAWESGDLFGQAESTKIEGKAEVSTDVTAENLAAYLQDRFKEPGLKVTSFMPLAGGFGKHTIMFAVEGKALSGEFVMRRDMGDLPTIANDCHRGKDEYPVVKAAHARGFPAPDALWLDTEHKLLPGGDFFIMRRALGKLPGNFFGARTAVPPSLTDALADIMARLHTLPPLTELGDLTDSIRLDWWKLSKREATERYIRGWYELYLRSENMPSPSMIAIFGWLLDNLPDRAGPPSFLHGDIGFHNFLFHEDKLSAALDWEFAHIGDPAEELGMVKVTVGASIEWDQLMKRYIAGGGEPVDDKTLRYFQVWGYARNAAASNMCSMLFTNGNVNDLKLTFLPYAHFPNFIRFAQALIDGA